MKVKPLYKRRLRKVSKVGLPPGSLVFTGDQRVEKVLVHYLKYDHTQFESKVLDNHESVVFNVSRKEEVDWYDFRGLHDVDLIRKAGEFFNVHSLALEDVIDPFQRPKFEDYQNGLFLVFKAYNFDKETKLMVSEQVGLFYREGLLLSFQESGTDLFSAVRERLLKSSGRIRTRGADYLCYALMDEVVDNYYTVVEDLEDELESHEEELIHNPKDELKLEIYRLKKELLTLKKGIYPLREAVAKYRRCENELITNDTRIFINDLYDHVLQSMEMVENLNSLILGLHELYNSEMSFKMNQVMQVLTIIASLFIPITFLAGIYGMNFEYIPELQMKYGYLFFWVAVAIILGILLFYFKRKKWL